MNCNVNCDTPISSSAKSPAFPESGCKLRVIKQKRDYYALFIRPCLKRVSRQPIFLASPGGACSYNFLTRSRRFSLCRISKRITTRRTANTTLASAQLLLAQRTGPHKRLLLGHFLQHMLGPNLPPLALVLDDDAFMQHLRTEKLRELRQPLLGRGRRRTRLELANLFGVQRNLVAVLDPGRAIEVLAHQLHRIEIGKAVELSGSGIKPSGITPSL